MAAQKEKVLNIEMFGGFQVFYGDEPVVTMDSRNSKVLQLLQYLVCNRQRMVPQEELISILLGNEDCDNPAGTLKNLVYRLRKLLEEAKIPRKCIAYEKGAYGFRTVVACWIDEQEFLDLIEKSMQTQLAEQERFDLCMQAVDLYRGGFLPRSSGEPWVMGFSVKYQEMYCGCLRRAYGIANRAGWHDTMVARLRKALTFYPYEEDLALMYIHCLHATKRVREAVEAYESVTATLLNDLGIGPSERMQELFQEITGAMQEVAASPADICRRMLEEEAAMGPFYCNFEVFTNLYRFVVRHMERSGQSVFLMLCTLAELSGAPPESGERTRDVVERFHEAVRASLRRGDAYARYSPSQFVMMLMEIKQENCSIVAERMRRHFYRHSKMNQIRFTCKSVSAADMDVMLERFPTEDSLTWD